MFEGRENSKWSEFNSNLTRGIGRSPNLAHVVPPEQV